MSTTGVNNGELEMMVGSASSLSNSTQNLGEGVMSNFAALTGGDMQGSAADATNVLGQQVQSITAQQREIVTILNQQASNTGADITGTDQRFAGMIA